MNELTLQRLDFTKIKEIVKEHAVSYLGRNHVQKMQPMINISLIRQAIDETGEALAIVRKGSSVPIPSLEGIESVLELIGTGYVFREHDFTNIQLFLHSCHQLKRYMSTKSSIAPKVSLFASSLYSLDMLNSEISRCIKAGRITNEASKELNKMRKKINVVEERIKTKIDSLLLKNRSILQENYVSVRDERYVLPINKKYRKQVKGTVLDESASGQTVYIEPDEIRKNQQELVTLKAQEAVEESKILSYLTGLVEESAKELNTNIETVGVYDFIFAKAKFALVIDGNDNVQLNERGFINLKGAKHPFLENDSIPLDFTIGEDYRTLVITGPNTGGKTVALKTVGLLTLMVQSGMLVPVHTGSEFSVFTNVLEDIGDGQSIEQSLSTFSAHIKNVINIINDADDSTLILLDEMASGTDPGEGVGLSIAILEELYSKRSTVVATTHFNEIKNFAANTPGFENARMEFDVHSLQPLYRLRIGEAGESYAYSIALKLGMHPNIIRRSEEITGRVVVRETVNSKTKAKERKSEDIKTKDKRSMDCAVLDRSSVEVKLEDRQSMEINTKDRSSVDDNSVGRNIVDGETERNDLMNNTSDGNKNGSKTAHHNTTKPFEIGDRVHISYMNKTGVVYEKEDSKGNVGVMIQQKRLKINKKRLTLHISKEELYPDNYDYDILFESKEDRKKKKLMNRKHVDGLSITKHEDI